MHVPCAATVAPDIQVRQRSASGRYRTLIKLREPASDQTASTYEVAGDTERDGGANGASEAGLDKGIGDRLISTPDHMAAKLRKIL